MTLNPNSSHRDVSVNSVWMTVAAAARASVAVGVLSFVAVPVVLAVGESDSTPPQIVLGTQKPPEFPPAALAGRFSGAVTMQLTILATGEIGEIEIVDCTHKKLGFEEASIAAVKQWRFEPATTDGEPVEATVRFRMSFNRARPGGDNTVSLSPFSSGGDSKGKSASQSAQRPASAPPKSN